MPVFTVALFDQDSSKDATLRGLAAFFVLLFGDLVYYALVHKAHRKLLFAGKEELSFTDKRNVVSGLITAYSLLCSGVAIMIPPDLDDYGVPALWGAAIGLLSYGILNSYLLAVIPNWPIPLVILDIAKGVGLTALSSVASAAVFFKRAQQ